MVLASPLLNSPSAESSNDVLLRFHSLFLPQDLAQKLYKKMTPKKKSRMLACSLGQYVKAIVPDGDESSIRRVVGALIRRMQVLWSVFGWDWRNQSSLISDNDCEAIFLALAESCYPSRLDLLIAAFLRNCVMN